MAFTLEATPLLHTIEEFANLDLPEVDENGNPVEYELIRGEIMPRQVGPSAQHGDIVTRIATFVNNFAGISAGERAIGRVYTACAYNLGNNSSLIPDMAFVLNERLPAKFTGPLPVAPDLIVEVNSPADTLERIHNKVEAYREAGVRLIWSIYTDNRYALVHTASDQRFKFVDLEDRLDGGEVIPGFGLPLRVLFD